MSLSAERKRLFWASRRGMLELDIIFQDFLEQHYDLLETKEQDAFRALLECNDQELYQWFLGNEEPTPEFLPIIQKIRASRKNSN